MSARKLRLIPSAWIALVLFLVGVIALGEVVIAVW